MAADGRVEVDVLVDDRDAQKKLVKLRRELEKNEQALFVKSAKKSEIETRLEAARDAAKEAQKEIDNLAEKRKNLELIQNIEAQRNEKKHDYNYIERRLDELNEQKEQLRAESRRLKPIAVRDPSKVSSATEIDAINEAREKRKALKAEFIGIEQEQDRLIERQAKLTAEIEAGGQAASGLRSSLSVPQDADIAEEIKNTDAQIASATKNAADLQKTVSGIEKEEEKINSDLTVQEKITTHIKEQTGEIERQVATKSSLALPDVRQQFENLGTTVRKSAKSILRWGFGIRSTFILMRRLRQYVVSSVTAFAEYDEETKKSISGIKGALSQLKYSFGSVFAGILNAIAPLIQQLIGWLNSAANAIANFMAVFTGKSTYKVAIANQNALTESVAGTGAAAKEAQKYLSGLDEMKTFQDDAGGGGGGGGGGNPFEEVEVDPNSTSGKMADFLRDNLESMMLLVDEFIFVIGMILTFTSANIPLGIALMIAGAYRLYHDVTENPDAIKEQLQGQMGKAMAITGALLVAIGILVACIPGKLLLGLGMIAVGAADLFAVAVLNWDTILNELQGGAGRIVAALGTSLVIVGLLLMACQMIPVGLGCLVAGGAALGLTAYANWDSIVEWFKRGIDSIKGKMEEAARKIKQTIMDAIANFDVNGDGETTGQEIIAGILNGIFKALTNIHNWLKENVFDPILNGIKSIFGIASPATEMESPGEDIGLGILEGFLKPFKDISGWIKEHILDPIKEAIANFSITKLLFGEGGEEKQSIFENITLGVSVEKMGEWADDVVAVATEVGGTVKKTVQSYVQKGTAWAKDALEVAKMKTSNITKKATSYMYKGKAWVADAFTVAKMKTTAITKTATSYVKKGKTWVAEAWKAAQMKTGNVLRTVTGATKKSGTWNWNAYDVITSNGGSVTTTAVASVTSVEDNRTYNQKKLSFTASIDGVDDGGGHFKYYQAKGGVYSGGKWHKIAQYASGGLARGSQLFWARERGPELVGTLGGHTAVMNNDQIVASVANGVARAIAGIRFQLTGLPLMGGPLMATGAVAPPRVLCTFEGYDLDDIVTRLDALLSREERPINFNGTFTAKLRGREVLHEVVRQGKSERIATGKNPFDF